jgi:queuine tRNA-ribosyltransferase
VISFENDLDSLRLALDHPRYFKHLRHAAPGALLAQHEWTNPSRTIEWSLLAGDFAVRKFEAAPPDIIYFDPFSFKTDGGLWTLRAFRELAGVCANRPVELFTYTYSTSVRAAMLAAGFHVAKGWGSYPKAETTVALSPEAAAQPHDFELLGAEWLAKWRRSDAQAPPGSDADDSSWRDAVERHPQFAAAGQSRPP